MSNIVVTGASGYIGSSLIRKIVHKSSNILAVSRSVNSFGIGINAVQADIRNPEIWTEIANWADIIFHLAGNTSAIAAASDPAESLRSTVLPVVHLVRAAAEHGHRPRVIFASTATVYGITPHTPVDETYPTNPLTIYDLHKLFAEQQLAMATQHGVIEGVSLRLANVYGPSLGVSSAKDRGILNKVVNRALRGEDLTVYGGGNYLRDYVYIDDVIDAFICAGIKTDAPIGAFNVASGKSVTIREAFELTARKVELFIEKPVRVTDVPWPSSVSKIEARDFVANIKKSTSVLKWAPQVSLDYGVEKMIKYFDARKGCDTNA